MVAWGEESGGTDGSAGSTRPSRPGGMYRLGGPDDAGWALAPEYRTAARGAASVGVTEPVAVPDPASAPGGGEPLVEGASAGASQSASADASTSVSEGASPGVGPGGPAAEPDVVPDPGGAAAAGPPAEASSGPAAGRPRWGLSRFGGLLGPRDDADRLRTVRTTPLYGPHRIAVIGLKAGAGRTTTAAVLGSVLAAERADRVIAVDADPASGTLGRRVAREAGATVRDLITASPRLDTYTDIRAYTSRMPSGLEVLADDTGPAAASRNFHDRDYRAVVELLGRRYPLVLTDTGAGLSNSALPGVLDLAHQLVLVATPSVDGVTSASTALSWLEENGFQEQSRHCITVISGVREPGRMLRAEELVAHFKTRCRGVVVVPYDEHLAGGGELNADALRRRTRAAHLELAALVAEGFARPESPPPGA